MAALMMDAVHSTGYSKLWDTGPFKIERIVFKIERIVSSICEYVGPDWLFLAGINKLYKKVYGDVNEQTIDGFDAKMSLLRLYARHG
jgi:hypothetical protein